MGTHVVSLLRAEGHTVTVFVHTHNPYAKDSTIRAVDGSIDDVAAVTLAVKGSDAVISTLGSWGTKTKDIVSIGTKNIVQAMEETSVKRLVTLTGGNALWSKDRPQLLDRLTHQLLTVVAGKILIDGEAHLTVLDRCTLDWTAVRSPIMTGQTQTDYRLTLLLPNLLQTIPRAAVARCLVDQLARRDQLQSAPIIARP